MNPRTRALAAAALARSRAAIAARREPAARIESSGPVPRKYRRSDPTELQATRDTFAALISEAGLDRYDREDLREIRHEFEEVA